MQKIYRDYLFTLRDIESIIERYFEYEWYLYEVYKYQHSNPKLAGSLRALERVCDQITREVGIENDMMLILGSTYSIGGGFGFESQGPGRFVFVLYFERDVPPMWGLIGHEIGHAFLDKTQFTFKNFNEAMEKSTAQEFLDGKTDSLRKEEQILLFKKTWNRWKEEFFQMFLH